MISCSPRHQNKLRRQDSSIASPSSSQKLSRGISNRGLSSAVPRSTQHKINGSSSITDNITTTSTAPRRQSAQLSIPKGGFGLARQSSRKMLTSTSLQNLERLAAVAEKEKLVEHHNR